MEIALPTLTIKGLPEPVYRRLKDRAESNHRSLNGEIIACLERAVGAGPFDPAAWLADVDAFRGRSGAIDMSDDELRAARGLGRA
jgi:plasmid stability protein